MAQFIIRDNLGSQDAAYTYYIEEITRQEESILIKGWVYSRGGVPVDVVLTDSAGETIGDVWRKTRKDVKKKFDLNDDYNAEFLIRFVRNEITDKVINIRLSSADGDYDEMMIPINMAGLDESFTVVGKLKEFLGDKPIRRSLGYVKRNNPAHLYRKVREKMKGDVDLYAEWRSRNCPDDAEYDRQRNEVLSYRPLISIVIPLYNTPIEFLDALLASITGQTYDNWQLILADGSPSDQLKRYIDSKYADGRIRYKHLSKNLGISGNTNEAIKMADGEYIMLADHDDILDIGALYEIVSALNRDSSIDIIYTDEDLVDASGLVYSNYRFKPDYNLELLRHLNYICHIFCVRKSVLDKAGWLREKFDGAQDYDLILRCCELTDKIYHIPKVLYHWRAHEDSTAGNIDSKKYAIDASVEALREHYKRLGIDAEVEATDIFIMLKTTRKLNNTPLVSIIIPNKDHAADLDKCIRSVIDKSTYSNYEIIVVENNSTDESTFTYYDDVTSRYDNVKVVRYEGGFNYSKINNYGVKYARGDYYVLLNNDIEVISTDWMERMLGYCEDTHIGAVGAKLLYPDDTVQHSGVVIGIGGFAGHIMTGVEADAVGYYGRLRVQQEISAVTAACMMVDAKVYAEIGGFDEDFAVALNDVDLCLKIRDRGYKIILDPNVTMYHYESKSRGYEDDKKRRDRFRGEIEHYQDKWKEVLRAGDPYYSPNLTLIYGDCSPRRGRERFE